ncbi:alpha/beta fold hydrolase [Calidifontibacter sp. DB0510]|uniref:Alpha/beta fold hydrolase n=1 Tax=Metallococcus carri TaxID=1656884 RepID=A0A967E9G4_9MICO|nr:lipase family protein [Metallococcus carri]NHN56357.1 alpha/beta fold hydrolase [Metallococcus carri]NOP35981.1 alpha/beta fold hydrolase [Calidifontibacter sp. DB2511S]
MPKSRALILSAAAAIALAGFGAPNAGAETSTDAQFYTPPATLPAQNGALIRQEPIPLAISLALPGMSGPLPGKATRIMYKSTETTGQAVAVTGVYFEPTAAWSGAGPRPLVSMASGTIGQGDQCAPSRNTTTPVTINEQSIGINYDLANVYALLSRGVAVVMTDYVGLGTPDRVHTYVNRVDQGHAVLDAARAARSVTGASITPTSKVGAYGYSQGGGAAASAAELQPAYAPDVPLAGAYAGAPPADLQAVLESIDGTTLAGAIGWAINGFLQTYPAIAPKVDLYTNAAGKAALERLKTMCVGDAIANYAYQRTSSWTSTGQPLAQITATDPELKSVVDAQRLGRLRPGVPVRVISGTQDDIVDHRQARQLAVDWCAKGANVDYLPYAQLPGAGTSANHLAPAIQDEQLAQNWMIDRLNGKPAVSNCAALPLLP